MASMGAFTFALASRISLMVVGRLPRVANTTGSRNWPGSVRSIIQLGGWYNSSSLRFGAYVDCLDRLGISLCTLGKMR